MRSAFSSVLGSAVGDDSLSANSQWLAHGRYEFKGVEEPIEVFEVGIPGKAPLALMEKCRTSIST